MGLLIKIKSHFYGWFHKPPTRGVFIRRPLSYRKVLNSVTYVAEPLNIASIIIQKKSVTSTPITAPTKQIRDIKKYLIANNITQLSSYNTETLLQFPKLVITDKYIKKK